MRIFWLEFDVQLHLNGKLFVYWEAYIVEGTTANWPITCIYSTCIYIYASSLCKLDFSGLGLGLFLFCKLR